MKKLFTLLLGLGLVSSAFAQDYYSLKKKGIVNPALNGAANFLPTSANGVPAADVLLEKTTDDAYSADVTMPFSINFYGQSVNKFKVSDNGYLTFDLANVNSTGSVTGLDDANAPANSIFAFWKNWEMKAAPNANFPVRVIKKVYGSAPSRHFVVSWFGISEKGTAIAANADVANFSIVFEEGSDVISILYGFYGKSSFTGAIGMNNMDKTKSVLVGGTTNGAYPISPDASNDNVSVIEFIPGIQPVTDMSVINLDIKTIQVKSATISGTIANFGSASVTSFDLNYTVNGGTAVTQQITGVNIAPNGGTYAFTHSNKLQEEVGKNYAIEVYATNINGNADEMTDNDKMSTDVVLINGTTTDRVALIEEGSGAWCGYCPDGHIKLKEIIESNPGKVIGVVHHNRDGMVNPQSDIVNANYMGGYPNGVVDRNPNQNKNRSYWANNTAAQLAVGSPVKVNVIDKNYNSTTREITFTIEAEFVDFYGGDIRLGAMVVENNVRGHEGTTVVGGQNVTAFNQSNYFSNGYSNPQNTNYQILREEKYQMVGYFHDHVVRAIPSGAWGKEGIIPAVVKPGEKFTYEFSYILDAATNVSYSADNNSELCSTADGFGGGYPANVDLIGFVSSYGPTLEDRIIHNSAIEPLFNLSNSVENNIETEMNELIVYPNPANQNVTISLSAMENTEGTIEISNLMGQITKSMPIRTNQNGQVETNINTSNLSNGIYLATVKVGNTIQTVKFTVSH